MILSDIADFKNGKFLSRSQFVDDGEYPIYGSNGIIGRTDEFLYDDKLIVIGRVGSCGEINISEGKSWITDNTIILKPNNKVDFEYLVFFLKQTTCNLKKTGTSQPLITQTQVKNVKIPVPPLPAQRKIASILEKSESAKRKRQETNRLTDEFLKSAFLEMFGDPLRNPKKWDYKILDDACELITDGAHYSPKFVKEGFPFASVRNIIDGKIDIDSCKKISKADFDYLVKNNCRPQKGDVLFTKDGTIGKVLEVIEEQDIILLSSIAILRPHKNLLLPTYLKYILAADYCIKQALGLKTGSALKRIILKNLRNVKIPIPRIDIQQKFANLVQKVEALKSKQQESKKELDNLFNSLMQKVFKGEIF